MKVKKLITKLLRKKSKIEDQAPPATTLTDGSPVTDDHREINPATGMQKGLRGPVRRGTRQGIRSPRPAQLHPRWPAPPLNTHYGTSRTRSRNGTSAGSTPSTRSTRTARAPLPAASGRQKNWTEYRIHATH